MLTLTSRLGYSDLPNIEAQQRLAFTIKMIYNGAKGTLGTIKISFPRRNCENGDRSEGKLARLPQQWENRAGICENLYRLINI